MDSVCFARAAVTAAVCLVTTFARAQAPELVSFQGHLTNTVGDPLDSTDVSITFKMYKSNTLIWTETQVVDVVDGIFDVLLGWNTAISPIAFDRSIMLGITLDGEGVEMVPRVQLASAPYALGMRGIWATNADDGVNTGINIIGGASNNSQGGGAVGATIGGGGGTENGLSAANSVSQDWATVSGGSSNSGDGEHSTIGGGKSNSVSAQSATIGGGSSNMASHTGATVGGGSSNTASGIVATVSGGDHNKATLSGASVGGGQSNSATGSYSTVSGGYLNRATATDAVVPGGHENMARGTNSFAAGYKARAKHDGAFVWNDHLIVSGDDSLLSTGPHQFIVRAHGGVGINRAPAIAGVHLKQLGTGVGFGFRTEYSDDTDYWETYVDVDNHYNFAYNGAQKSYIVDTDGSYVSVSDASLKEDVEPIVEVLSDVLTLHPATYRLKDADPSAQRSIGFIAQEVEPAFPELVSERDGLKGLNYAGFGVVAIKAIQELYAIIQAQQAEIDQLKAAQK